MRDSDTRQSRLVEIRLHPIIKSGKYKTRETYILSVKGLNPLLLQYRLDTGSPSLADVLQLVIALFIRFIFPIKRLKLGQDFKRLNNADLQRRTHLKSAQSRKFVLR
ncbi:hypothetical protein ACM14_02490 [Delftia sp. JD2]|nr:hypothetical protein ACM14_02490 [Delftia sp. JD2]